MGASNTRKACIGGLITYTTANGRTAWNIIRQAALFVKGLVCCSVRVVVLPKISLCCVGFAPARRFCFPGSRGWSTPPELR